ncbi:methyltransferase domain-containing protein [Modestobacter sp. VKM Ac-2985]|uniref:methyltransferase domain-containing protein n=1 Tax=Modestobacter sp. VKM Ac-2985 TaxID=3004139 RepID=UPI0022AB9898|nr:methyltransferase domain-containing protein [Modestobacter sp. VKM Ac-2985]MCZ2838172.1 methylase [Modestobacter sp. VKM Ac-2985]
MDPRDTAVLLPQPSGNHVVDGFFDCAEESAHYAFSVQLLLTQYATLVPWQAEGVAELGSGDARAIAHVVRAVPGLQVHGTDISTTSVERARQTIDGLGVSDRYTVEHGDFFAWADSPAGRDVSTVIANPPYIPAPDADILMPELWGGWYGNDMVLRLLKAGFEHLLVALPSYSDPAATLSTARDLGYQVANFLAMGLEFGAYSGESKVRQHIAALTAEGHGWAGEDSYVVAVALLTRSPELRRDRSTELLRALQLPV